jgi:predicted nucleic acid-binding protein
MSTVVVDATVLVGFCDPDETAHEVATAALTACLAAGTGLVVPVSVLSEVLTGAYRNTPHAVRVIEGFVKELASRVYPIDRAVGRAAAQYRAEHPGLPLHAALVLGTAKIVNAERILTTDASWIDKSARVHIVR